MILDRAVVRVVICLALGLSQQALSAATPRITGVGLAGGRINLNWNGAQGPFEVQSAADPAGLIWSTVLHTVRSNVVVPLVGGSGFYRVVTSGSANPSLVVTTTNASSGDIFTLTLHTQTNADLVFDNLSDTNASVPVQVILPVTELQKFDIAFDGAGGFSIVTTNGDPGGSGGIMTSSPGPGPNRVTFTGFLTNGSDLVQFSSVAGPPLPNPGIRPMDNGGSSAGSAGDTGSEAFSSVWCAPAWAVQNLGCQSAAAGRTFGCVGGFPPKASAGYGYIANKTGVTITATNLLGSCESHCVTCCKDLGTGALSNCTP